MTWLYRMTLVVLLIDAVLVATAVAAVAIWAIRFLRHRSDGHRATPTATHDPPTVPARKTEHSER